MDKGMLGTSIISERRKKRIHNPRRMDKVILLGMIDYLLNAALVPVYLVAYPFMPPIKLLAPIIGPPGKVKLANSCTVPMAIAPTR